MSTPISVDTDTLLIAPVGVLRSEFAADVGRHTLNISDPPGRHLSIFDVGDVLRITAPGFEAPADASISAQMIHKFWLPGGLPVATECDVWLKVMGEDDQGTHFAYDVQLMSGEPCRFPAGTVVARYGSADAQRILLTSIEDGAPYIDIFDVGAEPWTGSPPRLRIGRLDGLPQIDAESYGLAVAGDTFDADASAYTILDDTGVHLHDTTLTASRSSVGAGSTPTAQLSPSGRLLLGTNISAPTTTNFDLNPADRTLSIRATVNLFDRLSTEGAIAITESGRVTLLASPDGSLKLGPDVNQAGGAHLVVGADGALDIGADRQGGAALNYAPASDSITIRAKLLTNQPISASGSLVVTRPGGQQIGAQIGGDGDIRFGTNVGTDQGTSFALDSGAGTLLVRADTRIEGDLNTDGDIRLGQNGTTHIHLSRNGDVRFGRNVDVPSDTDFYYSTSERQLTVEVPLEAALITATTVNATRLTVSEDADVAGTLAIGDEGAFVVGTNRNIEMDSSGLTMRMLPGENNSIKVLSIGRAALVNAYQTADNVQNLDMLAYYNSGIPSLHGRINFGVANAGGGSPDLYLRFTRYHTGARNAELSASFVDILSDRIQLRGSVNVRGDFEFSGGADRILRLRNLPLSSNGLPQGAVWNDGGTLRIVL